MTINQHLTTFGGFQVRSWEPGKPLNHLDTAIYRISVEYDDETSWPEKFQAYLNTEGSAQSRGLVVGMWGTDSEESADDALSALLSAKDQLPLLEAIFFGDIISEENEMSWIYNTDHGPLFQAYPHLKHYGARGGNGLRFSGLSASNLQTLLVQTGALDVETLRDILGANLPELNHLELYFGSENYGANIEIADLTPLFEGSLFPKLTYLGLKNAENQDEIAQVVVNSPILARLEVLDLSLGILSDEGGQALLASADRLAHLKKLDLHHHFMTDSMQEQLQNLAPEVDLSDAEDPEDDWRFVSISE